MILLQSKDLFDDILLFDPQTSEKHYLKRSSSPEFAEVPIKGTFAILGGHSLMLYRLGSQLMFSIDEKTIPIDDTLSSVLQKKKKNGLLILKNSSTELLRFEYTLDDLQQMIPGDTTPHLGEEDFDFCTFVHNVLNNHQRRSFIYQAPEA